MTPELWLGAIILLLAVSIGTDLPLCIVGHPYRDRSAKRTAPHQHALGTDRREPSPPPAGPPLPRQWSEPRHTGAPWGSRETTWPPVSRAVGSTPAGGCRGVSAGGAYGQPVRLRPSSAPEPSPRRRREAWTIAAGVAVTLAVVGGACLAGWQWQAEAQADLDAISQEEAQP